MKKLIVMIMMLICSSVVFSEEEKSFEALKKIDPSIDAKLNAIDAGIPSPNEYREVIGTPVDENTPEIFNSTPTAKEIKKMQKEEKRKRKQEEKALKAKTKKNKIGNYDLIQFGYRLRSFNGLNTLSQPTGFATTSTDSEGINSELFIQIKWKMFGIEYLPNQYSRTLETKFYGSSLGSIKIITSNVLIGKLFLISTNNYNVSIGIGSEFTKIDGVISMGGFAFTTGGEGWSPILQLGGSYQLTKRCSLGFDYERSNIRIITLIPGAPDLVSTYTDRMSCRLMLGIF